MSHRPSSPSSPNRLRHRINVLRFTASCPAIATSDSPEAVFFSSRRRHTRLQGDWSSDVCRLFYVAVTRARNELYLSYPLMRVMPGSSGDMMQQPSRFLGEIPKELVEEWNLRRY